MPTAGRLTAAIAFAVLGWYTATLLIPAFEEGRVPSYLIPLSVACGIWAGWVVCGKRTGRGYVAGISNGITAMVAMVFWIFFIMSFVDMVKKSFRKSYDGPVEALVDVFTLGVDHVTALASVELGIALCVGGVLAGLFAEFFAKRYP